MKVKIKKLVPSAVIPCYAKGGDAGLDLTLIAFQKEGNKIICSTGLAIEIPKGYVGLIFPRSSVYKTDLRLSNAVGVIDSGYRGELKSIFDLEEKPNQEPNLFKIGERFAQLIIMPYPLIEFEEVEDLSATERGEGGFGSSGFL